VRIDFDDFEGQQLFIGLCEQKAAKYRPVRRFCSRFPLSPTGC
jgi:hypothetical protein